MKYTLILLFLSLFAFGQNTYQIAILKYNGGGDWYANPTALPNLIEFSNKNIVKVSVNESFRKNNHSPALNFFRSAEDFDEKNTYHHIGIYAFTDTALVKYVKFPRSRLEIDRNLEQMRALDNNMRLKVGLSDSTPLSIDTEEDLSKVSKQMEKL